MAGGKSGDRGEVLFERYLVEHGYEFEYELYRGVRKRPDYLVQRSGMTVVCEVKSFPPLPDQQQSESPQESVLNSIRNKIREAAKQLKPLAGRGVPLLVVLAQAENSRVMLHAKLVLSAMYGNLTSPPEGSGGTECYFGRNGKLRNDHRYISAVVVAQRMTVYDDALVGVYGGASLSGASAKAMDTLRQFEEDRLAGKLPAEENRELLHLDVYETDNDAPRLPTEFFQGSRDTRWAPDPTRTRVIRTR